MATLPSAKDLGIAPVNPSGGVVSYRGDTGGEGAFGRAAVRVGEEVDKVGQFLIKAQEENAKLQAMDGLNKYQEKLTNLAYSETGWANTKGGNTTPEFYKKTQSAFDSARQEVESTLTDPMARKLFSAHAQVETLRSHSALMQHMSKEQMVYRNSVYEKGMELEMGNMWRDFGNDEAYNARLMKMANMTYEHAISSGASKEAAQVAVSKTVDDAWAHRIKLAINADDVPKATELYKQARDGVKIGSEVVTLSTKVRESIDAMLKPAQRGNKEMKVINEMWDRFGPKGRNDPAQIEPMMESLRKQYPNESATFFGNVLTGLTQRANLRETDINKADGKAYGVLQEALSSGKNISQLQKMPEWAALTPAHHAALQDKAKADAYQAMQRGAASESRAYTQELREFNRIKMKDEQLSFNGYGTTYELLSNPEKLMRLSPEELTNMSLTLGRDNVNRLRVRQEQLKNPSRVEINKELFTTMADEAGLKASSTPEQRGKENNSRLLRLREAVDNEVQIMAGKKGHPLTNEETREVMQKILDRKVMVDEWGRDPQRSIATVLPDEKVYVPIEQVPPQYITEAVNYMKSIGKIPQMMTTEAAAKRYQEQIGKAYGARQIPGTKRSTIESILAK